MDTYPDQHHRFASDRRGHIPSNANSTGDSEGRLHRAGHSNFVDFFFIFIDTNQEIKRCQPDVTTSGNPDTTAYADAHAKPSSSILHANNPILYC